MVGFDSFFIFSFRTFGEEFESDCAGLWKGKGIDEVLEWIGDEGVDRGSEEPERIYKVENQGS